MDKNCSDVTKRIINMHTIALSIFNFDGRSSSFISEFRNHNNIRGPSGFGISPVRRNTSMRYGIERLVKENGIKKACSKTKSSQ